MAHSKFRHHAESFYLEPPFWERGRNIIVFIGLIALAGCAAGAFSSPGRFRESWLFAFAAAVTILLGGAFFVMIQYLTGSAWSVTLRRLMENIMVTIPAGALLFLPIALGARDLYQWARPEIIAHDKILQGKAAYMNPAMFSARGFIFFALWSLWAVAIWRNSTRQDTEKSIEQMHTASRWSAPGLLLIVVTGTLASFDWLMSLDPHWYSTIFGIYCLAGGALAFFAVLTLTALGLRNAGVLKRSINPEHYHDLGKWMFALTVFWAYIAFSQYLLIWYANIPEETIFYKHRFGGSWAWVSVLLLIGRFIVPFAVLLGRAAKRNLKVLAFISSWILLMHLVDMYWLVAPNFQKAGVQLHWLDFACVAAVFSVLAIVFWSRMHRHAIVPVGDMRFEQGLRFENI
jgi:hypothetical protein